ncbi:hypothetical protein [Myxococcus sp. Y35]|uniref:hypothetical protein n=1 Tax=Pseudomyxococcus flavus TaxID=3115648 RepID=UPI003CF33E35
MRSLKLVFSSAVAVALCSLLAGGCGGPPASDDSPDTQVPQSGGLGGKAGDGVTSGEGEPSYDEATPGKITICHYPPGNPANAHTLSVGAPAWPAHERHGDTLGPCEWSGEPDAGSGEEPGGEAPGGEEPGGEEPGGEEPGGEEPGGGEPDGGAPTCAPIGETCGDEASCCFGLMCGVDGFCEPIIG